MARLEARFRTDLKKLLRPFCPISIENALTTPGLPDLLLTVGMAELKALPSWPVKPTTPLRIPHFTPVQRAWALRWTKHGGNYWLIVKVGKDLLIFDEEGAQKVGDLTRAQMIEESIAYFDHWPLPEEIQPFFRV